MKKILFISHEASRTGAPILLFNLVKWFYENKKNEYIITVLFLKGGSLFKSFDKYSETYLLYKYINKPRNIVAVLNNIIGKNKNGEFYKRKFDLIFSNTVTNGKALESFRKISTTPIISYIHELDYSIKLYLNKGFAQGTLEYSNFLLCGSKSVQNNIVNNLGFDYEKTAVVYSASNIENIDKDLVVSAQLKNELNISKDSLVVAMAGTMTWRKGIDLFVETAELLESEDIYFIWIGADNKNEIDKINYDLDKSGKKPKILFIPSTEEYQKYFNLIDIFFLSSREDPYPLVMVDATLYGIPVICFEKAGGAQEFIDKNMGFVVPFGNTNKVAEKICYFFSHREELLKNKDDIQKKSIVTHNINDRASDILSIIENFI